jgi:DNA-binding MarR family transcriptional regulator
VTSVALAHRIDALGSELVVQAARFVRAVRSSADQPVGVRVLSLLDEHGELSVTQLAEADRCSQPTMSGTVQGLLDNGWVTKEPHPRDARRTVVRLTEAGAEQLGAYRTEIGAVIGGRIRHHDRHTEQDLRLAIEVLRDLLTDHDTNPRRDTA